MSLDFRVDSEDERAFRREARAWLEANLPQDMRGWSTRPPFERSMWWHAKLHERGWIAPHWPRRHGGMGATIARQLILREELARIGAPELSGQGINHVGPILMAFGAEAQQARHLPPILTGEVVWCQGYSEPGAGSDLAALRTRAELQGDRFVVNGQKIWTTWAHHAHWIYVLARTDPDAPRKQAGISFLLIDLATPGITIRPIATIAGDDEFAELFFDDVEVPRENLVGSLHDGWRVANALLAHERLGASNPSFCLDALERARKVARATGALDDPAFRDRLVQAELDVAALSALFAQAVRRVEAGEDLGPAASIVKIVSTETLQRVVDLLVEAAGGLGAASDRIDTEDGPVEVAKLMLQVRRATIYGGSSEIQRNILAKRALGLPT